MKRPSTFKEVVIYDVIVPSLKQLVYSICIGLLDAIFYKEYAHPRYRYYNYRSHYEQGKNEKTRNGQAH